MLEHVILKLKASGFTEIVINIHHFGEQILDFLKANDNFGLTIHISDEREQLLDTGGGVRKACTFFEHSDEPFLVHNVDILSDVDLKELYDYRFQYDPSLYQEYAFSGIHVLSPAIFRLLDVPCWEGKFSIMDFYLATCRQVEFSGYLVEDLRLIDIGKPETLAKAEGFCTGTLHSDA